MNNILKVSLVLLATVLAFSVSLIGCGDGEEEEAPITLKLTTVFSTASPEWGFAYEPFKNAVEENSDGRLLIELYPSGTLVPFLGSLEAAMDGIVDIAFTAPLYHLDYLPLEEVWCVPPLYKTAMGGVQTYLDLYEEYFKEGYTELGLHRIGVTISPPYWLFTKSTPIYSLEDFQGLNIRGGTAMHAEVFDALGANTLSIISTETYDALQKGTLDGAACYPQTLWAFGWYETGTPGYIIDVGGLPSSSGIHVVNKAVYDSLPADLQEILDDAGEEYLTLDWCQDHDTAHVTSLEAMEEWGCETIVWTSEDQQRLKTGYSDPIIEDWVEEMEANGYPAEALVDAIIAKVSLYE